MLFVMLVNAVGTKRRKTTAKTAVVCDDLAFVVRTVELHSIHDIIVRESNGHSINPFPFAMLNLLNVILPIRYNKIATKLTKSEKHNEIEDILQQCHERRASIDFLFSLLVDNFDQIGLRNFIINYFFEVKPRDIMFYTPQLCYMNVLYPKTFLEKLLIETCAKSTEFFICVC